MVRRLLCSRQRQGLVLKHVLALSKIHYRQQIRGIPSSFHLSREELVAKLIVKFGLDREDVASGAVWFEFGDESGVRVSLIDQLRTFLPNTPLERVALTISPLSFLRTTLRLQRTSPEPVRSDTLRAS